MQIPEATFALTPIAVSIENAPQIVGVSRTRIFEAIRNGDLSARKAGRSTIIETDELKRWVRSLPVKRELAPCEEAA
jgi:excisionase family DNA binding protein